MLSSAHRPAASRSASGRSRRCSRAGCSPLASFTLLAFARSERWEIYLAAALLGAGIGLAFAAMANLIIENVGPEQTGVATGMNTVTRTVGGAFGGAATASILAGTLALERLPDAARVHARLRRLRGGPGASVSLVGLAIPQRRPEEAFGSHETGDLHAEAVPGEL